MYLYSVKELSQAEVWAFSAMRATRFFILNYNLHKPVSTFYHYG